MGSFSASCGMSKLPITSNEQIVFVALQPVKQYSKNKSLELPSKHLIHSQEPLYNSFFLPIEGEYNTYGGLDNIVKNDNTKLLEEHYGKSIEQIFDTMTCGRGIFDSYSDINKIWNIKLYETNTLETFKKLGFELIKIDNKEVMYNKEFNLKISNDDNSDKFEISKNYILNYETIQTSYDFDNDDIKKEKKIIKHTKNINIPSYVGSGQSLQSLIYNETNIILGLKNKDDMKLINELISLSGTFFLKEVYDKMSKNLNFGSYDNIITNESPINYQRIKPIHLRELGFEQINDKKFKLGNIDLDLNYSAEIKIDGKTYSEGRYIETVGKLIKYLNSKTNLNLNTSNIEHLVGVKTDLLDLNDTLETIIDEIKSSKLSEKQSNAMLNMVFNAFDSHSDIFKNNSIYSNHLINLIVAKEFDKIDELCSQIDSIQTFENSMTATNNYYIPSFSGYQDGCMEMNKYLNEIISSIIKENDLENYLEKD